MKKTVSLILAIAMFFSMTTAASAVDNSSNTHADAAFAYADDTHMVPQEGLPREFADGAEASEISITTHTAITDMNYMDENRQIALNAPSRFGYGLNWEISQETVLYNLSDEIVAYCFDMVTVDDISQERRTSYAIVNADETGFPLLLFGIDGISAYYDVECDKAYYLGLMGYYVEVDSTIFQPQTLKILETPVALPQNADADAEIATETEDFSGLRDIYIYGTSARNAPDNDNIENHGYTGSNLMWDKGCTPTAIAMLIKTHYSNLDATELIAELAEHMGTDSEGSTIYRKVKSGIKAYFSAHTELTMPSTYGWNSTNLFGDPKTGISNNSKESYRTSIKSGFPVGVALKGTTVVTPGYPADSITAHTMAGMGYSFSSSGDFITCYTTYPPDGLVSFPLTSTGLKDHAWFWLKW